MTIQRLLPAALLCLCGAALDTPASAQIVEGAGSRALGMGGAFVAVASDSSATWWNPAGLAAGPFLDMALARAATEVADELPARRDRASWFAFGTPPFGVSFYRLRITDIRESGPTGDEDGIREDPGAGVPVRSLAASQLGITLVQTIVTGVHAATTLKYVRGTLRVDPEAAAGLPPSELLDRGEELEGGAAQNRFDLDVGVIAVAGPLRLGGVMRHVRQPEFGDGFRLPRQARVGAAFDADALVGGVPLVVAVDADTRRYETASGERRVVAVGAEQWFAARRIGIRGGGRFNMVGARERSATLGGSVAVRPGMYLDGHLVRGGSADDRGWGTAARVSF